MSKRQINFPTNYCYPPLLIGEHLEFTSIFIFAHLVILSLQQPSGVFAGDEWGEIDTRFLYCAVNALSLLGRLSELDIDKTVSYIRQCKNFDGGYGNVAGAESHAGQG